MHVGDLSVNVNQLKCRQCISLFFVLWCYVFKQYKKMKEYIASEYLWNNQIQPKWNTVDLLVSPLHLNLLKPTLSRWPLSKRDINHATKPEKSIHFDKDETCLGCTILVLQKYALALVTFN